MTHISKNIVCFLAVFICMIGGEVKSSQAQSVQQKTEASPFIVKNIRIDVTANSAKEARDKAFRQAQQKSLPILLKQLETSGYDTSLLRQADPKSVANAIKDFEIANEKISSVRYKGNFVFRYDENLLSHYFYNGQTVDPYAYNQNDTYNPYTQNTQVNVGDPSSHAYPQTTVNTQKVIKKDRVLVLPFFQSGHGNVNIWEGYNPWKDIWTRSSTGTFMAPIGDLADFQDIKDGQALTYDPEKLAKMSERYFADRVVVLVATHENASLPTSTTQRVNGVLRISAYDTARGRPEFINEIRLNEGEYRNFGEVLQAGYNRSIELLQGITSVHSIGNNQLDLNPNINIDPYQQQEYASNAAPVVATGSFQARIEYTSMQDWITLQKELRAMHYVANLEVLSLSSRQAEIKISHSGAFEDLATAMTQQGYNIQPSPKAGRYTIYKGRQSAYNQNGGIVYR
ncbi:MAG: DUF2066 domain-containing protein [Alphaproteobacteria bacterium]|nr:DUF2066 domain-containing protein [Alphaproteobacteria bacterium]